LGRAGSFAAQTATQDDTAQAGGMRFSNVGGGARHASLRRERLPREGNLLHAVGRVAGGHGLGRRHQSQALQQKDGALGSAAPNQLAAFTLTVLHIGVAAGIFQAAIAEDAVDEDAVIKHQMLILKGLALVTVHKQNQHFKGAGWRVLAGMQNWPTLCAVASLTLQRPWTQPQAAGGAGFSRGYTAQALPSHNRARRHPILEKRIRINYIGKYFEGEDNVEQR
jgi:hypothetical protein